MITQPARIGIDIGGSSVKMVSVAASGEAVTTSSERYIQPDADHIAGAIRSLAACHEVSGAAVGVCAPGQFEADGRTIRYAANLPALASMDLSGLVRTALPRMERAPTVTSDAIAAARGCWSRDSVPGRLLALSLGTGVGAALLVDGTPLMLAPNACGHVGQLDVSLIEDAPLGPDGGRGSLEAYVGLPALRERFDIQSSGDLGHAIESLPEDDEVFVALARAIRICHAIYTPDHVRLLGGVGIALSARLETIRSHAERDLTRVARPEWSLAAADDPYLAALGAADFARVGREAGPS